jgi:SpoVK/Ycf46/Vps4 family AAA+-type ATPase
MQRSGRLLVKDNPKAPAESPSFLISRADEVSYDEFLSQVASECQGFSGASIAAVCRAAASHALERAVERVAKGFESSAFLSCVVTLEDFQGALADVAKLAIEKG